MVKYKNSSFISKLFSKKLSLGKFLKMHKVELSYNIKTVNLIFIPSKYIRKVNKDLFVNKNYNVYDRKDNKYIHMLFNQENDIVARDNNGLDISIYRYYFLHESPNIKEILESGFINSSGSYEEIGDIFNSVGIIKNLSVLKENIFIRPGVYFQPCDFINNYQDNNPLYLDSKFKVSVHYPFSGIIYGSWGLIYPIENIFKYRVSLFNGDTCGAGEKQAFDDYMHIGGGELVVNTNKVPVSESIAHMVLLSPYELELIYDTFGFINNNTFGDVVELYKENRDSNIFIKLSSLMTLIDFYGDSSLPPIFCVKDPFNEDYVRAK